MKKRSSAIASGHKKLYAGLLLLIIAFLAAAFGDLSPGPDSLTPPFRIFGGPAAPIKLVEYSDFSCPACGAAWSLTERILSARPDSVTLEFKHYPLTSVHPWSFAAAAYADCAGRQGKFREYAGLLFARQGQWARSSDALPHLAAYAAEAGLDKTALSACLADPATAAAVNADMADGDGRKVSSTPTFFVNGKRAVGPAQLAARLRERGLADGQ